MKYVCMYLPVNQIYIRLQRLTSEKSDRLVPKLSARAFMGLLGGGGGGGGDKSSSHLEL